MKTNLTLSPRRIGIGLGILALVMSLAALIGDYTAAHVHSDSVWPIIRQFDFIQEGNIANYYQSAQLLLNSALLLLIWAVKKQNRGDGRWHWLTLAGIFLFLSCDEVAQIHEGTVAVLIAAAREDEVGKTGWFWIYLPLLGLLGATFIPFLKRLPRRIAALFVASGGIYVGGVVVMEKVANWFAETYGDETTGYVLIDNLSELMESAGMALFAYTLLSYLAAESSEILIQVRHEPPGAPAET